MIQFQGLNSILWGFPGGPVVKKKKSIFQGRGGGFDAWSGNQAPAFHVATKPEHYTEDPVQPKLFKVISTLWSLVPAHEHWFSKHQNFGHHHPKMSNSNTSIPIPFWASTKVTAKYSGPKGTSGSHLLTLFNMERSTKWQEAVLLPNPEQQRKTNINPR